MLQITNGVITISVSTGAFRAFYKDRGFEPTDGAETHETSEGVIYQPEEDSQHLEDSPQPEMTEESSEESEEAEEEIDLSEIPLGEMSFDELTEYADQLGLDHSGIRSKRDLRALIREHKKG